MTDRVNGASLETMPTVSYNPRVRFSPLIALICAPLLMGGACEKKSTDKPASTDTGAVEAADKANAKAVDPDKVDTTPLAGFDAVGKLDADKQKLFYTLMASLNSPCGKAHSLRTSVTTDAACKRAPFAVRYVLAMLEDDANEQTIREYYTKKYEPKGAPAKFDTSKAPHAGSTEAPIKLVEFYDYACPHCQHFKPVMDEVLHDREGKVQTYYMMFPIHPDSKSAAQAALAANAQGKFEKMHDMLFAKSPAHDHDAVTGYAKELGLDMAKFEADYQAAGAQVDSDQNQGRGAGVDSTPTIFFNDRRYEGPPLAKYLAAWIDEELAAK